MRSIRLSLVLYFLVLLALAFGAVGGLVFWTTAQIVRGREKETGQLLEHQYKEKCNRDKARFDRALRNQAHTLASLAQFQFQGNRQKQQVMAPVGLLTAAPFPDGCLLTPFWAASSCRGSLCGRMYRLSATEIQFNEDHLPAFPDGPVTEYFQITSEWGNTWKSRSLEGHSFPVDFQVFETKHLFEEKFDELELTPGLHLRRLTLQAPASRFRFIGKPKSESSEFLMGPGVTPALLIQVACDTATRDRLLLNNRAEYEQELEARSAASRETLATLRHQVLGVGLATFALTVIGGFFLVRLGLSPLARLSDAVSQVSEKDFRLQFNEPDLPAELRPIVERLTHALDQLQRAFAREKQAAADISHELRTPLAALMTTVEVALRKSRSAEEYRETLGDCRSLGQQMSQLVERLLALARLDAGVDQLRPQHVDAAALADQCAALVRPLAEAHELTLRVHRNGPACLTADPDKLREVLTNLLGNAIEYNRPHGSVDLKVERDNGHLQVEVCDTGIGIKPEARAQIFQRFYRADPSRQATGLHAGLGLAIVKGYVDLMGGSITVESVEGEGSTFRVQLPAEDDKVTR
jgi:heavy metal sensor kinase